MVRPAAHAYPLSAGSLAAHLDRWEDGYLVDLLGFLERLAVTPARTIALLDRDRRANAEACLDTAVEMGLSVSAARAAVPASTSAVVSCADPDPSLVLEVPAPFTLVSHETAYAATTLSVDVPAGRFPVRFTTIDYLPVPAGQRPYYAHVDLPAAEVVSSTHGVSSSAPGPFTLTRYAYSAVDGAAGVSDWVDGVLVVRATFRAV